MYVCVRTHTCVRACVFILRQIENEQFYKCRQKSNKWRCGRDIKLVQ